MKNRAFTLIELLITISIISLLFGVVISNSIALRSASDDTRRKADLAQIQSALQNYYADQNYYPRSSGNNSSSGTAAFILHGASATSVFTSSIGSGATSPSSVKTYLSKVPTDTDGSYCYVSVDSSATNGVCTNDRTTNPPGKLCNYYYLYARLKNSEASSSAYGTQCGSANYYNYRVNP